MPNLSAVNGAVVDGTSQHQTVTYQLLAPNQDITSGSWLPSTGATLYGVLDETSPDPSDYAYTSSASTFEVKLSSGGNPSPNAPQTLRYQLLPGSGTIQVTLKQGASTIATWSHSLTGAAQLFYQTLTSGQVTSISDYSDLRVEVTYS
jgi:hypothetical protein